MKFEQYSRLAICLNIFWFLVNNSKTISKFEKKIFPLVCRACQDLSIDIAITHCSSFDQYSSLSIRLSFEYFFVFWPLI